MQEQVHKTTPDGVSYRQLLSAANLLSYSTRCTLHSCPRRFALEKANAENSSEFTDNVDFLFGHAVGGGVQSYLLHKDLDKAFFEAFLAWKGDLSLEKKVKSIGSAIYALEKFAATCEDALRDWEIFILPSGKAGIEISFTFILPQNFFYCGHIDGILYNKKENKLMVLELKTNGSWSVDESMYKNSSQALGYGIVVDAIAESLGMEKNYEVLYAVYRTTQKEWNFLPFMKTEVMRKSFLLELEIDTQIISSFQQLQHFPMHGESCYSFQRRCEFFGICDMGYQQQKIAESLVAVEQPPESDFIFDFTN